MGVVFPVSTEMGVFGSCWAWGIDLVAIGGMGWQLGTDWGAWIFGLEWLGRRARAQLMCAWRQHIFRVVGWVGWDIFADVQ